MRPGVAVYGRKGTDLGSSDWTAYYNQLIYWAECIKLASANTWSIKQSGQYDAGHTYPGIFVIMEHGNGAELMLHVGNPQNAGNRYAAGSWDGRTPSVAFKRSGSAGTFATVTDLVNPYLTATYCDDADAFKFYTIFSKDNLWYGDRWFFLIVADRDSAFMWMVGYNTYDMQVTRCHLFADDGGTSPNFISVNAGDTYKAFVIHTDGWFTRSSTSGVKGQYYNSSGVRQEAPRIIIRDTLSWKNDKTWPNGFNTIRQEMADTTGRKGVIDDEAMCTIRSDAMPNAIMTEPGQTDYNRITWGRLSAADPVAVPYPYNTRRWI